MTESRDVGISMESIIKKTGKTKHYQSQTRSLLTWFHEYHLIQNRLTLYYLRICLSGIALFFVIVLSAQTNKNTLIINFGAASGYGYPIQLGDLYREIPTSILSTEYPFNSLLTLGVYTAYTYASYKYPYPPVAYKNVWKGWDIGIHGSLHIISFFKKEKKSKVDKEWTDLYLKLFSGFTSRSLVYDKTNIYRDSLNYHINTLSLGSILGLRYFINTWFGLYAEIEISRELFFGGGVTFRIFRKK